MDNTTLAEIQAALTQMEAEDKAQDAQRRGRAKLKAVVLGFVEVQKAIPALESKQADISKKIASLDGEYSSKVDAKERETSKAIQGHQQRESSARTRADDADQKAAGVQAKLAGLEGRYRAELEEWTKKLTQVEEHHNKLQRDLAALQRRHGLVATG